MALIPIVFVQSKSKRVCLCLSSGERGSEGEKDRNKDPSVREANESPLPTPNRSLGTAEKDNSLVAIVVGVFFLEGLLTEGNTTASQHAKVNNYNDIVDVLRGEEDAFCQLVTGGGCA